VGRRNITVTNYSDNNNRRKKTIKKEIVIGPVAIKFVSIIIIAILAVVYLSQSTAGAGRSVKIRDIESKKSELNLEKERLEVEQTRLKALKEIDNGVEKPSMEPISQVNHPAGDGSTANAN
jgi:hypothetical protein